MIRAVLTSLLMSVMIQVNAYGAEPPKLTPSIEAVMNELPRESRYIIRENAEIYDDYDGAVISHGHLGGTVEIVPALSNEEFTTITTCDGIAYIRTTDLGTNNPKLKSLGTFRITHYCACAKCGTGDGITASGRKAQLNHTIAMNRKDAPLGAKVIINGQEYTVDDRGVKAGVVDVFVSSHSLAKKLGVYKAEVFIVGE